MDEQKISLIENLELLKTHWGEEENYYLCEEIVNEAIATLEEIKKYRALGTVEELRKEREKQISKKPTVNKYYYFCPRCGTRRSIKQKHNFCHDCGQRIDWSEEE